MTILDFREKMEVTVQDKAGLISQTERDKFIVDAVYRYSLDRPFEKSVEIQGDGGYDYTLPSSWLTGFSQIISLEYPLGKQEPSLLERNEYQIYNKTDMGEVIRFLSLRPAATEKFKVTFSLPHTVDVNTSSLPPQDFHAVCDLASSLYERSLASYYAKTADSTIGADAVSYRTKAEEHTRLADKLEASYRNHISDTPGTKIGDWDTTYAFGWDYLFHPRRWR